MGKITKAKGINANFVQIPNSIVQSKTLTLKAKGMLCYLLSLPEDWVLYKTKLHVELKEGRDATIEAFNELVTEGYIEQEQSIDDKGRFEYDYIVHNQKVKTVNASTVHGKSVTDNPYTVNPSPYKENKNKEIKQTTKEIESVPKFNNALTYERHWDIPVPSELKNAWGATPILAEKWEAFCISRFQSHNVRYASEVQEATAIKLFVKKCGTVGKAISSLDICISKGYKHPDYYNESQTKSKEPKIGHLGIDVSRLAP